VKDPGLYIEHITGACARIRVYTVEGRGAFMASPLIQDAVARNLQIIGEATKRLPEHLTTLHPEVPWRHVAGMRNRLVHEYAGLDLVEIWNVIEKDLPALESAIEHLAAIQRQ
jgi:uncharacterized protein with HEPN domain